MSSILTNTSAMVALQTLKATNKGMAKVQDEISTGLKVSTAKDNSSSWSIASTMSSDVGSYKKLGELADLGLRDGRRRPHRRRAGRRAS